MQQNPLERVGITQQMIDDLEVTPEDREAMHSWYPLTGRYRDYTRVLNGITSEYEWNRRRIWVETEYLIALGDELDQNYEGEKTKIIPRPFTSEERTTLRRLYDDSEDGLFGDPTNRLMKFAEDKTHQDVVAMERVAVYKLSEIGFDPEMIEAAFHFARTSNDINSIVFCSMVRDCLHQVYIPLMTEMEELFIERARTWSKPPYADPESPVTPFAGQTHGQYAVPTTLKKVMANFASGLKKAMQDFLEPDGRPYQLEAKFGGPIGNESGLYGAYPDHDWDPFIEKFVKSMGFEWDKMTDQDGFNLKTIKLFDAMVRVNDVLLKYAEDFWDYCSRGVLIKIPKSEESGSSSMTQKVNAWRTEGGWLMLEDANVELGKYHDLARYKRQGDLRRSRRRRFLGVPFALMLTGVKGLMHDLSHYNPVPEQIQRELDEHPDMAAFYLQTVFKREGVTDAYDRIKDLTMGKRITLADLEKAIDTLVRKGTIERDIGAEVKEGMQPAKNTGAANKWTEEALEEAEAFLGKLKAAF